MEHVGHVALSPLCLIKIRLIFVDEPLSGWASIEEDHARDLLRPSLRINPRLKAA
jgi:hypothetical protein